MKTRQRKRRTRATKSSRGTVVTTRAAISPPSPTAAGYTPGADYGAWLDDYEWTHAATLTYRYDTPPEPALHEVRAYQSRLEQRAQGPVTYVAVAELTHPRAAHVHALLAVENVPVEAAVAAWRAGHSQVKRYRRGGRAARYLAKT